MTRPAVVDPRPRDPRAAAAPAEAARLAALRAHDLPAAAADPELDALVRVAAALVGVPTATLDLLDATRQHRVAAVGAARGGSERAESLGARDLDDPRVVHVPDARRDPRYATSAWVDGRLGEVVLHAAAPLVTAEGHHLGSLCVGDVVPRELSADQLERLRDLAGVATALLGRHRRTGEQQRLLDEVEEQRALAELTLGELQAREELTQALLDSLEVGVVACDADGALTAFNPAARRFHGMDAGSGPPPAGSAPTHVLYDADGRTPLEAGRVPLRRALAEGSVRDAEVVIAPRDGDPVRVLVTGRALHDDEGRVLGAVVAMQDITADRARIAALEQAGEQLRHQGGELAAAVAELRRSNEELVHLAAVASHDLASPLTAVLGYLELVLDVHGEALGGQGREWMATAVRAALRMQGLIEAVLDHARAGSTGFSVRPVLLPDVLAHVVEDLGPAADDADIAFEPTAPGAGGGAGGTCAGTGVEVETRADPVLLRQLLQNLVGNAVRYRSPLRPCRVRVSTRPLPGGGWELLVADNGRGIPAGQREQVFAMFAVAPLGEERPGGTPAARPGHGIGLATCLRIVERHGGRIRAEETPGGGATLRCTFPAARPAGAHPSAGPSLS
ncbi:signal transduction histidine kinase [Kineococcus radiotolerans]|uniref:Sensor-like histidine kinase SenX3 n=1 Tax=Kineococcus radiotolerans TaxID=131568 RepID=A0A7W4TIN3_KINRA|nr:ATP-binding protein [Kineococcus radiotolerans]MBB2899632.1 signal transduction histidine kinase [Kineococcus radiotolerans]